MKLSRVWICEEGVTKGVLCESGVIKGVELHGIWLCDRVDAGVE